MTFPNSECRFERFDSDRTEFDLELTLRCLDSKVSRKWLGVEGVDGEGDNAFGSLSGETGFSDFC